MLTCLLFVFFLQSQEKREQLVKQSKEEEEIQRQQEKQRETEQKAQEKYKNWLQKKNQEKIDEEKRQKVMWTFWCYSFFNEIILDKLFNYFFFLDRRKQPWRRSRRKSAAGGHRRSLRSGCQKPMRKAEPVPNHLVTKQVRSFQSSGNY